MKRSVFPKKRRLRLGFCWKSPVGKENGNKLKNQFTFASVGWTRLNFRFSGTSFVSSGGHLVDGQRNFDFPESRGICLICLHQKTFCLLLKIIDVRPVTVCLQFIIPSRLTRMPKRSMERRQRRETTYDILVGGDAIADAQIQFIRKSSAFVAAPNQLNPSGDHVQFVGSFDVDNDKEQTKSWDMQSTSIRGIRK